MKPLIRSVLILGLVLALCACGTVVPRPDSETPAPALTTLQPGPAPAPTEEPEPATIRACFAEEAGELGEHETFVADEGEWAVQVVFSTDKSVKDFRFLALAFEDVDEQGRLRFAETELLRLEELTPERSLMVTLVFYGDLPNNGISYVDADGTIRRFALSLSGEDGSLILSQID